MVLELLNRLPRWVETSLLLTAVLVVFVGSSIPPNDFPDLAIFNFDKVLHLIEYTCFGLATWVAARRRWLPPLQALTGSPLLALMLGLVLPGAVWAVSDEIHQLLVGRDCNIWDWCADLCGLLLAVLAIRLIERREATRSAAR